MQHPTGFASSQVTQLPTFPVILASVARKRKSALSVAIIGSGNLAHALGPSLLEAGYRIDAVVTRNLPKSRKRAASLARQLHSRMVRLEDFKPDSDIIWICHTDDAVESTARTLAQRGDWKRKIVLHSSGALTSDALAPLQRAGAHTASLHPMMTFVTGTKPFIKKVPFAVEGKRQAVSTAKRIVRDLGGHVFPIRKQSKVLYHALGSFSSPMVVATLVTAQRVGVAAGFSRAQVTRIIRPILEQTIRNFLERDPASAFSGPIKRGDVHTIREHLRKLARVPGATEVYRALVKSALMDLPIANKKAIGKMVK